MVRYLSRAQDNLAFVGDSGDGQRSRTLSLSVLHASLSLCTSCFWCHFAKASPLGLNKGK